MILTNSWVCMCTHTYTRTCVCMYIYVYCIYPYFESYTSRGTKLGFWSSVYIWDNQKKYAYIQIRIYTYTYVYIYMHTLLGHEMYTYIHIYVNFFKGIYLLIHTCVCACVCVKERCVSIHIWDMKKRCDTSSHSCALILQYVTWPI